MGENKYRVYFHVKQMYGKAIVGIVIRDWFGKDIEYHSVVVSTPEKITANTLAIIGWIEALKFCIEDEYEDVIFITQNKFIFNWFEKGKFNYKTKKYYEKVTSLALKLTRYGSDIGYEVCVSNNNPAKNFTNRKAKELKLPIAKGNLMEALETNKKILDKNKKVNEIAK